MCSHPLVLCVDTGSAETLTQLFDREVTWQFGHYRFSDGNGCIVWIFALFAVETDL